MIFFYFCSQITHRFHSNAGQLVLIQGRNQALFSSRALSSIGGWWWMGFWSAETEPIVVCLGRRIVRRTKTRDWMVCLPGRTKKLFGPVFGWCDMRGSHRRQWWIRRIIPTSVVTPHIWIIFIPRWFMANSLQDNEKTYERPSLL